MCVDLCIVLKDVQSIRVTYDPLPLRSRVQVSDISSSIACFLKMALVIVITLPLHEGIVSYMLFGIPHLAFCITTPLHANYTITTTSKST